MPKKNIIKQVLNEGHAPAGSVPFQYDIPKSIEEYKKVKPQDVFEGYKKIVNKKKKK
tara:strand:+ start:1055 stop:1225 length:171 start_codon:yes stop_codon:yes gene_type:complete